jgi:subtilisin family serine protease
MKKHLLIASLFVATLSFGQKKKPDNWQTLDPMADNVWGVGAEEAYKTLKDKTSTTVIVAVIDSGVDPNQEDLKDVLWTNAKEIPDNGKDDDGNGYIDDVHGWSFLGGKNGDIGDEATELTRIYQKMSKKYNKMDTTKLAGDKDYTYYKKIKAEFLKEQTQNEQQLKGIAMFSDYLTKVKKNNGGVLDKEAFKKYTPDTDEEKKFHPRIKAVINLGGIKPEELEKEIEEGRKQLEGQVRLSKINADSVRHYIVGDDVDNVNEKNYGNNHIQGPDALHGTHVSGMIAAARNNGKGINGIANNVKIMVVRAVPNGDERDKDVANAIRYAVDNGAKIINMSFGKYYSPDKKAVDDAVKYAAAHDVLMIHAAGNESKDNDKEISFPNRNLLSGEVAGNWINVGASAYEKGKTMIGSFSNYGQKEVDFFAPGVDIYSTLPDNKYANESGTSMAAPSTSGAAAIVREYFPNLKAEEVKAIMIKTVVPYKKKVIIPGTKKSKRKVKEMCVGGGFVNANNAVKELLGMNVKK